jgi:acetyltransferase
VTNAGGPAVLATDALLTAGGELAEPSAATIAQLDAFLPSHWSHQNPIDILGDASAECYAKAVDLAVQDSSTDGTLVILAPQAITDPAEVAQQLAQRGKAGEKPLIASWMGGLDVAPGEAILQGGDSRVPLS